MPEELLDLPDENRCASSACASRQEAVVKALGTGLPRHVAPRFRCRADPLGKPGIIFSPRGQQVCRTLGVGDVHSTLSDEAGLVVAVAILMKSGS